MADKRKTSRLNVVSQRLDATLATVEKRRTLERTAGCLVPVMDIAKGGAGVYMKFPLAEGTNVRLYFERFPYPPFEGKVAWCEPCTTDPHAPQDFTHRAGIEFTAPDDEARENQLALYEKVQELIQANDE